MDGVWSKRDAKAATEVCVLLAAAFARVGRHARQLARKRPHGHTGAAKAKGRV